MQKERQKKEKEEQEEKEEEGGAFPQTTLERRKKVQERKNLLSPKMPRRGEQPVSPTRAQATLQDESEEVKRLTARVKELELVSVHRRTTHTHTHTCTRAHVHTYTHHVLNYVNYICSRTHQCTYVSVSYRMRFTNAMLCIFVEVCMVVLRNAYMCIGCW